MSLLQPIKYAAHGTYDMAAICTDADCEPCRPRKDRRRAWNRSRHERDASPVITRQEPARSNADDPVVVVSGAHHDHLMRAVTQQVAAQYDIPLDVLMGRDRTARIAEARQVCFWVLRERCFLTFAEIGAFFGRDHSTVHHGARLIGRRVRLGRLNIDVAFSVEQSAQRDS